MKKYTKLALRRDTLRRLASADLQLVSGGRMPDGSDRDHTCDDCGPTTPMMGCTL